MEEAAALAVPFAHMADLFLAVAEIFVLWGAVSAWRVFLALWYNVEGPNNDPYRCPYDMREIPSPGISGTAQEICAQKYYRANGWTYIADCHELDCSGGSKSVVVGWNIGGPGFGTKPEYPNYCQRYVGNPTGDCQIKVTDNSRC